MLPLPEVTVWVGLVLLVVVVLPLGAVLLRLGERILGRKVALSTAERFLLAFYASGALLFVLASVPIAFYGYPLIVTVLSGGAVAYAVICYRERGAGLRTAFSVARTAPGLLLGVLTIGVLAMEIAGVAGLSLVNTLDGSLHSLFVNLLIANRTLPWTYSPYAAVGVVYPQGTPVWMSLPVLLFGWPIVSAPLNLPPLFLALSVVAAFCLGQRLTAGLPRIPADWFGLLFAAFFGLLFTWPRLWVGGSFDFAFGLPLFLLLLGWSVPLVRNPSKGWTEILAFGIVVGVEISLSLMLGIATLLLLAGYILTLRAPSGPRLRLWAVRWLAVVGISAGFLVRSLAGFTAWFSYPGHVLSPVGNLPTAPSLPSHPLSYGNLTGQLNPFVYLKPKISPIPFLTLEIQLLLAVGLVLLVILFLAPSNRLREYLPRPLVLPIIVGTIVAFVETGAILVAQAATPYTSGVGSVTYIAEASAVLFLFYELIAILPLFVAAAVVSSYVNRAPRPPSHTTTTAVRTPGPRNPRPLASGKVILVALVLLVPLATGIGASALVVPGYITNHIQAQANVSAGDIAALEWAGSHLPSCSRVLVAPGSVGQYLPEFAQVGVIFPAYPVPANLSYFLAVQDLDSGNYTTATHGDLVQLGVTEVLVSGQNTVSFPPFQLAPLTSSPDFKVLTAMSDVTILEFLPVASSADCTG